MLCESDKKTTLTYFFGTRRSLFVKNSQNEDAFAGEWRQRDFCIYLPVGGCVALQALDWDNSAHNATTPNSLVKSRDDIIKSLEPGAGEVVLVGVIGHDVQVA